MRVCLCACRRSGGNAYTDGENGCSDGKIDDDDDDDDTHTYPPPEQR